MNNFSKRAYSKNFDWLLFIRSLESRREIWSNEKASALPRYILRDSWSHKMMVASLPILSPCQWATFPWPISSRSSLNNIAISASVCSAPNHLFIICGGNLEFLSQFYSYFVFVSSSSRSTSFSGASAPAFSSSPVIYFCILLEFGSDSIVLLLLLFSFLLSLYMPAIPFFTAESPFLLLENLLGELFKSTWPMSTATWFLRYGGLFWF